MADEPNNPAKNYSSLKDYLKDYVKAEQMVQLALSIPIGCVLGLLVGSWLDHHFHTGWIAIAGTVTGAAGGLLEIVRIAMRTMKNNQ